MLANNVFFVYFKVEFVKESSFTIQDTIFFRIMINPKPL